MRCSWRKTTAGESRSLASLDGAVGRLLVQEGRCDEALWSGRTAQRRWAMIGKAVAGVEQSSEEVGPNSGREERSGGQLRR
jgi:hypothetical protein